MEYHYKVILIGPGSVGKTSLFNRFVHDQFSTSYNITMGVDFLDKEIDFGETKVKLTIWDIGGQERFKVMRRNYYSGTSGALLIFDLTRQDTYKKIKNTWYPELIKFCGNEIPFLLIGNKTDLIEDTGSVIKDNEVTIFAKDKNSLYIKTSAKTGQNVEEAFKKLTKKIAFMKGFEIK